MAGKLTTGDVVRIGSNCYTVEVADTFWKRFLGLMGRKSLEQDKALLITPCNSIHTFFMRFRMTAVFVDKELKSVVKVVPDMPAWRMAFAPKAYSVFELAGNCGKEVHPGDCVDLFLNMKREGQKRSDSRELAFPANGHL